MPKEGNPFDDERLEATVERTPTILILDTSYSMSESPSGSSDPRIDLLNDGLDLFKEEITEKTHTESRIDVSVITFGGEARVKQEFTQIKNWNPPKLTDSGTTPMADAIEHAIDRVEDVKSTYRQNGINYNRPLIWLLTDGKPDMSKGDDRWESIKKQLEVGTEENRFLFFALGIGEADTERLSNLVDGTGKPALKLKPGKFAEFFKFVSRSLESHSDPTDDSEFIADEKLEWAQLT